LPLLHVVLAIALYWIALGLIGLVARISRSTHARVFFSLGALGSLALAICAYPALSSAPQSLVLPLGLPDLPFHLRLDPLAAFFLLLLGGASATHDRLNTF
jgi:formate hydrogenlyase subunit 3/multisubunit Na+/H+ antiporter MnhD subunit